jgi:nucleotide-binding universal stress UspA family protein
VSAHPLTGPIVVAYDGSDGAIAASHLALALAARTGLPVVAVFVYEPLVDLEAAAPPVDFAKRRDEQAAHHRARLEDAARVFGATQGCELVVAEGIPVDQIIRVAHDRDATMIVTGTRRQGTIRELLLGSTSKRLVSHSDRAVMVVPPSHARR